MKNRQSRAGKKAWKESIRPSEDGYIKKNNWSKNDIIFHGSGFPDIMHKENNHFVFYEIKPEKGSKERTKLNPRQKKAFKKILEWKLGKIYLVKYIKTNKNIEHQKREEVTLKNLKDY